MRRFSPGGACAGLLLVGWFGGRAIVGISAAHAFGAGLAAAEAGRMDEAGRAFDAAAVGAQRSDALWQAGRARIEGFATLPPSERAGPRGEGLLRTALARFLAERVASPGSAWSTAEIGGVYGWREAALRAGRTVDLEALSQGTWALIGDDGRIAIGLTRAAVEQEPASYALRDALVLLLEENGLHDEALTAMAEAARVLPDFGAHTSFVFEALPRDLVEAFWKTARTVDPAETPLLPRERYLLSLGQLGRRLGHLAEAEHDLRAALASRGTQGAIAEESFHLALVLVDAGRLDEAEPLLARAARMPVFGPNVAYTRARIALKQQRWADALEQMRIVRASRPRELPVLLEFSTVAQKAGAWDQAEEAVRFAMLIHPDDPAARRALVDLFIAQNERERARGALDEYVRTFGKTPEAARLEQALAGSLDRAPH